MKEFVDVGLVDGTRACACVFDDVKLFDVGGLFVIFAEEDVMPVSNDSSQTVSYLAMVCLSRGR